MNIHTDSLINNLMMIKSKPLIGINNGDHETFEEKNLIEVVEMNTSSSVATYKLT